MSPRETMLSVAQLNARLRRHRWRGVRFLCYHSVADEPDFAPLSQLTPTITTRGFRRNLELIRSSGYRVLPMAEALDSIESGHSRRGQYICLTFDDGRLDNFTVAWPILREFGYPAHFFVSSALIGTSKPSPRNGCIDRYMNAEQLRAIVAEGGSIGSHGRSHRNLTTLDIQSIRQELIESRRELEALLGVPVTDHAYPYALYDRRVLQATREAGYRHAFRINSGSVRLDRGDDRLALVRNLMRGGADNPENYPVIQGGFDFSQLYSDLKLRVKYGV